MVNVLKSWEVTESNKIIIQRVSEIMNAQKQMKEDHTKTSDLILYKLLQKEEADKIMENMMINGKETIIELINATNSTNQI
jgi:hypothetical protein